MSIPSHRRRRALAAACAVAVASAGFVVVHAWHARSPREDLASHRRPAEQRSVPPSPGAPSPQNAPPNLGPAALVEGTHAVDGVFVGYPHSTLGAISAASEYLGDVASTLDPDRAAAIVRVAGDPDVAGLPAEFAHSTEGMRRDLRLPAQGALPAGVSYVAEPQMYQVRDVSADRVLVLLLARGTFTDPDGGMATTTGVFPMRMRWVRGDWRLSGVGGAGEDYSGLDAAPGTAAATRAGWQVIDGDAAGAS